MARPVLVQRHGRSGGLLGADAYSPLSRHQDPQRARMVFFVVEQLPVEGGVPDFAAWLYSTKSLECILARMRDLSSAK